MRPRNRGDFDIAIICALALEAAAVDALFDEEYKGYGKQAGDMNAYTTGRIGTHNIVLAHMPGMGKGSAASVAASLRSSFIGIKVTLLVGICGGVPFGPRTEVILGDVIIGDGIIQYDFSRRYPNGSELKRALKESLGRPSQEIRALLSKLEIPRQLKQLGEKTLQHLEILQGRLEGRSRYPGARQDRLFESSYRHKHYPKLDGVQCEICDRCGTGTDPVCDKALESSCQELGCEGTPVSRNRLAFDNPQPIIHIGTIASGDTVMKSGKDRDEIAEKYRVIAFEMEGAGVWDNLPCVVIKGVCDYADSHKNKAWQHYAAATAASCARAFLEECYPVAHTGCEVSMLLDDQLQANSGLDRVHSNACRLVPYQPNLNLFTRNPLLSNPEDGFENINVERYSSSSAILGDAPPAEQQLNASPLNTRPTMLPQTKQKQNYKATELQSFTTGLGHSLQESPLSDSRLILSDVYMSSQILRRLRGWWNNPSSDLLWIQEPIGLNNQFSTGKAILALAQKANIPAAACSYNRRSDLQNDDMDCTALTQMMLSLIRQIVQKLPVDFQSFADFSIQRFQKLNNSRESVEDALSLVQDLLQIGDLPLIVVIQGLHMLDQVKDQYLQNSLRTLLKSLQQPHNGLDSGGKTVKTLVITTGQTKFLIAEIRLASRCEASKQRVHKEALLSSVFARELLSYKPQ